MVSPPAARPTLPPLRLPFCLAGEGGGGVSENGMDDAMGGVTKSGRRQFLAVVASSLAFAGCADRVAESPPQEPPGHLPVVIWSDPVEGLALGIEQRGPVIFPRGEVDADATVRVHLRNDGTDELIWSDSWGVWTIRFQGSEFEQPKPFTDPMPPPVIGDPRRLGPGEECVVERPIVWAFVLWPPVPAGEYVIAVSYDPGALRTYSRGDSRGETRPFDVPGFWSSKAATPEIVVLVEDTPGTGS